MKLWFHLMLLRTCTGCSEAAGDADSEDGLYLRSFWPFLGPAVPLTLCTRPSSAVRPSIPAQHAGCAAAQSSASPREPCSSVPASAFLQGWGNVPQRLFSPPLITNIYPSHMVRTPANSRLREFSASGRRQRVITARFLETI